MNTLRHIALDVQTDLNQTFDDKKIELSQAVYWVLVIGDKLKSQHIVKRSSGAFLATFTDVPVEMLEENDNPNEVAGRKFFRLPKNIYDFHNDRAIDYIAYTSEGREGCPPRFTTVTFSRTTPKESHRLYYNKFEEPSPKNPFFYRTGENVYFLGIEKVPVEYVEIGIYMTFDPITKVDVDAPFDFPQELIPQLKMEVLNLGRFAILTPKERINEGSDTISTADVPTQKIVSVNPQQEEQVNQ